MSGQKDAQLFRMMASVSAMQEQMMETLDSVNKRLSGIELKLSRIEKWVPFEQPDFSPGKKNA